MQVTVNDENLMMNAVPDNKGDHYIVNTNAVINPNESLSIGFDGLFTTIHPDLLQLQYDEDGNMFCAIQLSDERVFYLRHILLIDDQFLKQVVDTDLHKKAKANIGCWAIHTYEALYSYHKVLRNKVL